MDTIIDEVIENDTSETIVVDEIVSNDVQGDERSGYLTDPETIDTSVASNTSSFDTLLDLNKAVPERKVEKVIQLPLTRVKNLMKLDPDVNIASQDAVLAIAKAAELFINMLGKEAYKFTKQNKKKTIQKKDINDCIAACESLAFLEGTLKDE